MKYIKTYEALAGSQITKKLLNDIRFNTNVWNDFLVSIVENDMSKFKKLIKTEDLEYQDGNGNTALLIAAKEGRLKMVKELIKAGANIFHTNNEGESFYDLAVNRYKFINNVKDWIEKNYPEVIDMKKYNL